MVRDLDRGQICSHPPPPQRGALGGIPQSGARVEQEPKTARMHSLTRPPIPPPPNLLSPILPPPPAIRPWPYLEELATGAAHVGLLPLVDAAQVFLQVGQLVEEVVTQRTAVRFFAGVLTKMHLQRCGVGELLRTHLG